MKRDKEKGLFSKRNLMAFFIVAIMVLSILGIMIGQDGSDEVVPYKEFDFSRNGNTWSLVIDKRPYQFDYHPSQVETINISVSTYSALNGPKMMYVTYDPESSYKDYMAKSQYDMAANLWQYKNIYVSLGFLNASVDYPSIPVITCENATTAVPVIIFSKSNTTSISSVGPCVYVDASSRNDVLRSKDRIMYSLMGIV